MVDVSAATLAWWGRLPQVYRDADGVDQPLLHWLDGIGAVALQAVTDTQARLAAGDLVDPDAADPGWLRWLAQMLGVQLAAGSSVADQRHAIAGASVGWARGTTNAIATAAATALTGSKWVVVKPSPTIAWTINVYVRADEAPNPLSRIVDVVEASGQRPAGYAIAVVLFTPSWDNIDNTFATWDDAGQPSTWSQVDSLGAGEAAAPALGDPLFGEDGYGDGYYGGNPPA